MIGSTFIYNAHVYEQCYIIRSVSLHFKKYAPKNHDDKIRNSGKYFTFVKT